MLPFADQLSPDEKARWTKEWRHLAWRSPRFVAIFMLAALFGSLCFIFFMPAWELPSELWGRWILGFGELGSVYVLSLWMAYGLSAQVIRVRMAASIGEMPNQSTDPTLSSGTPAAGQPSRHP